jgi:hypothetical protein
VNKFDQELLGDYARAILNSDIHSPWFEIKSNLEKIDLDLESYLRCVFLYQLGWCLQGRFQEDSYYLDADTVKKFLDRRLPDFSKIDLLISEYGKLNNKVETDGISIDWNSKPEYGAKDIKLCIGSFLEKTEWKIQRKKSKYFLIESSNHISLLIGVDEIAKFDGASTQLNVFLVKGDPDMLITGVNQDCVFIDLKSVLPFVKPLCTTQLFRFSSIEELTINLGIVFEKVLPIVSSFNWVKRLYEAV